MTNQSDGPSHQKLPDRFYKSVSIERDDTGFRILLDNKPIKTPKRKPIEVPTQNLANALKAEWDVQTKKIDPETMPLTKLVNTAIDGIADNKDEVIAGIAQYASSDALCYRAASPADLVRAQTENWDPILRWAKQEFEIPLKTGVGIMPITQPNETTEKAVQALSGYNPLQLGAIHVLTTVSGSFMITLALVCGRLTSDEAWDAAHVDENYQLQKWGEDAQARARMTLRRKEFDAANSLLSHLQEA